MGDFYIGQNDTAPSIFAVLRDAQGVIDLTDAAVTFIMKGQANGVEVTGDADVVSEVGGLVRYDWDAKDTEAAGAYDAQWLITFPSAGEDAPGKVESVPNNQAYIVVHVGKQL